MWHDWTIWVSVFSIGLISIYVYTTDRAVERRQLLRRNLVPVRIPRKIK